MIIVVGWLRLILTLAAAFAAGYVAGYANQIMKGENDDNI